VLERPRSAFAAGLAGLNLVTGRASASGVDTPDGLHLAAAPETAVSDIPASGLPVPGTAAAAAFSPRAVSVFADYPGGSPRNLLQVTVSDVEAHGPVVRIKAGHLSADITAAAAADLDVVPGQTVYFAVKATEVAVYAL
jgi:molybdate transport system ATP-binding protein